MNRKIRKLLAGAAVFTVSRALTLGAETTANATTHNTKPGSATKPDVKVFNAKIKTLRSVSKTATRTGHTLHSHFRATNLPSTSAVVSKSKSVYKTKMNVVNRSTLVINHPVTPSNSEAAAHKWTAKATKTIAAVRAAESAMRDQTTKLLAAEDAAGSNSGGAATTPPSASPVDPAPPATAITASNCATWGGYWDTTASNTGGPACLNEKYLQNNSAYWTINSRYISMAQCLTMPGSGKDGHTEYGHNIIEDSQADEPGGTNSFNVTDFWSVDRSVQGKYTYLTYYLRTNVI